MRQVMLVACLIFLELQCIRRVCFRAQVQRNKQQCSPGIGYVVQKTKMALGGESRLRLAKRRWKLAQPLV